MDQKRRRKTDEHDRQTKSRRTDEPNDDEAIAHLDANDDTDEETRLQIDERPQSDTSTARLSLVESDRHNDPDENDQDEEEDELDLGEGVYAAEKLLKKRKHRGQVEYLVKWKDWTDEYNTWEPAANILDKRLIEEFDQTIGASKLDVSSRSSTKGGRKLKSIGGSTIDDSCTKLLNSKSVTNNKSHTKTAEKTALNNDSSISNVALNETSRLPSNDVIVPAAAKESAAGNEQTNKRVKSSNEKRPLLETSCQHQVNVTESKEEASTSNVGKSRPDLKLNLTTVNPILLPESQADLTSSGDNQCAVSESAEETKNGRDEDESSKKSVTMKQTIAPAGITLSLLKESRDTGRTIGAQLLPNSIISDQPTMDGKENAQNNIVKNESNTTVVPPSMMQIPNNGAPSVSIKNAVEDVGKQPNECAATSSANRTNSAPVTAAVGLVPTIRSNRSENGSHLVVKTAAIKEKAKKETISSTKATAVGIHSHRDGNIANRTNNLITNTSSTLNSVRNTSASKPETKAALERSSPAITCVSGVSTSLTSQMTTVSSIVSSLSSTGTSVTSSVAPLMPYGSIVSSASANGPASGSFATSTLSTASVPTSYSVVVSSASMTTSLTSSSPAFSSSPSFSAAQAIGICSATLVASPASIVTAPTNLLNSPNFLQLAKAVGSLSNAPLIPMSSSASIFPAAHMSSLPVSPSSPFGRSAFTAVASRSSIPSSSTIGTTLINNPIKTSSSSHMQFHPNHNAMHIAATMNSLPCSTLPVITNLGNSNTLSASTALSIKSVLPKELAKPTLKKGNAASAASSSPAATYHKNEVSQQQQHVKGVTPAISSGGNKVTSLSITSSVGTLKTTAKPITSQSTNRPHSASNTATKQIHKVQTQKSINANKSPQHSLSQSMPKPVPGQPSTMLQQPQQQPLQVQRQMQPVTMNGQCAVQPTQPPTSQPMPQRVSSNDVATSLTPATKTFHEASKAILLAQQKGIKRCSPPPEFVRKQLLADQIIVTDVSENNVMITIRECKSQELFFRKPVGLKRKKSTIKLKQQQRTITAG